MTEITDPPQGSNADIAAEYERQVFAFLYRRREELGIRTVWRCRNQLIDGAIAIEDGSFIPIEIKYRMNWLKACQAEWQLRQFLRSHEGRKRKPRAGIVFFEAFSADWAKDRAGIERGWSNWYADHVRPLDDDRFRLNLVRFARGRLSTL